MNIIHCDYVARVFSIHGLPDGKAKDMRYPNRQPLDVAPAEAPPLTLPLTLLFAFAVGVIIINLTAAQPLAGPVARAMHLPPAWTGLVAMLPQLGYAVGMLFLVPLADLFENRRLTVATLALCALALGLAACPIELLAQLVEQRHARLRKWVCRHYGDRRAGLHMPRRATDRSSRDPAARSRCGLPITGDRAAMQGVRRG